MVWIESDLNPLILQFSANASPWSKINEPFFSQ